MKGCIITPTMRPEKTKNIQANVFRTGLPLIVVPNGRAASEDYLWARASVVGPQNKVECLALGVEKARRLGFDWYVVQDDDDIYLDGYADEYRAAFYRGARWCGKPRHFMRTFEGRLWIVDSQETPFGCTLGALTDSNAWADIDCAMFGEETHWVNAMGTTGYCALSEHRMVRLRGEPARHSWPVTDDGVTRVFAGHVWDAGCWFDPSGSAGWDVVAGIAAPPKHEPIPPSKDQDCFDREVWKRGELLSLPLCERGSAATN